MDSRASHTELLVFVGITAAFVVGLHKLGGVDALAIDWSNPVDWVDGSATEYVVGAALRSIGLVIGYWLLATTSLYAMTGVRGRERRPHWAALLTLPGVRKMVDRTLATAVAVSIAAAPLSPALATTEAIAPPTVVFDGSDGIPVPHVTSTAPTAGPVTGGNERPASRPAVRFVPPHPSPIADPGALPIVTTSAIAEPARWHTVSRGDNLWSIASGHLETVLGVEPPQDVVTEYWQLLVETNRDTLRSGDPNLIFPGELVDLPHVKAGQ